MHKFLVWLLALYSMQTASQMKAVRPLTIGDKVQDINFKKVLNYETRQAKLSDFKKELVILDMWSVNCASCITAFPKMDAMQKKFNDKVQILLVNPHNDKYDTERKIKELLEKRKERTGYYSSLPIPIHDTILNSLFPHQSVPHVVWISSDKKILAITTSNEVTEKNIEGILNGRITSLPLKNEYLFDREQPLLVNGNGGGSGDFFYRSLFTGYKGFGSSVGSRKGENGTLGYYIIDYPLRSIINIAYSHVIPSEKRVVLDVIDKDMFKGSFDSQYAYCYDLTLKPKNLNEGFNASKYLQDDLKRVFNISVYKDRRKMDCFVFSSKDELQKHQTKGAKGLDLDSNSIKKYVHNYEAKTAIELLSEYLDKPLIYEGSGNMAVDIDFPERFNLYNQQALIDFLKRKGFDIKEEEREIDVVVITDK